MFSTMICHRFAYVVVALERQSRWRPIRPGEDIRRKTMGLRGGVHQV